MLFLINLEFHLISVFQFFFWCGWREAFYSAIEAYFRFGELKEGSNVKKKNTQLVYFRFFQILDHEGRRTWYFSPNRWHIGPRSQRRVVRQIKRIAVGIGEYSTYSALQYYGVRNEHCCRFWILMAGYLKLKNRSSWHSSGPGPHNSNYGTISCYREPV